MLGVRLDFLQVGLHVAGEGRVCDLSGSAPNRLGARGLRQRVELQVFSNPSVDQASGCKSAKQPYAPRDRTRCVSEFRAGRTGSFLHDVGDHARLVGSREHLLQLFAEDRTGLAVLFQLRVRFQQVRVEMRLRVRRLDDRDPDATRA